MIDGLFSQNDENRIDVNEGGVILLQVGRGNAAAGIVNVSWQAVPLQAGPRDYLPSGGLVTFDIDQQFATIVINIVSDADIEGLEVIISVEFLRSVVKLRLTTGDKCMYVLEGNLLTRALLFGTNYICDNNVANIQLFQNSCRYDGWTYGLLQVSDFQKYRRMTGILILKHEAAKFYQNIT